MQSNFLRLEKASLLHATTRRKLSNLPTCVALRLAAATASQSIGQALQKEGQGRLAPVFSSACTRPDGQPGCGCPTLLRLTSPR